MNFGKFLIFSFLGSLPWCFVLALAGYNLGSHWQDVGSALRKYDIVVGVGIVLLIGWFIYRHVQRPRSPQERSLEGESRH